MEAKKQYQASSEDAIVRIREAEAQAERLRSEVKRQAAKLLEQARYEARKRIARARKEVQEEAEHLIEEAVRRARREAQQIERHGKAEAAAAEALAEENFENALDFVLKRVFPFPWDWPTS